MNKTSKLLLGLASLALMTACSNDEPGDKGGNNTTGEGDAYITVSVNATDQSRSASADNPEYVEGSANEHAVSSAKFFFFDANGNFVLNAKIMSPNFGASTDKPNVEWQSNQVLVLEDVQQKGYPKYMLTVLNAPTFEAQPTLEATAKTLADYMNGTEFVMSTSSYNRSADGNGNAYYCVNILKDTDFALTTATVSNPVMVYVERLAAKVELTASLSNSTITKNGKTLYKITESVAGFDNDNNEKDENGNPTTANQDLYLQIVGWDLNATAPKSHMAKQLKTDWFTTTTVPFTGWDNTTNKRSFWAWSYPYQQTVALDYIKNGDLVNAKTVGVGTVAATPAYCNENTNAPAAIKNDANQVNAQKVTHAVLHTIVCDENGNPVDLIRFNGTLYKKSQFGTYVMGAMKKEGDLNFYYLAKTTTVEGVTTNEYKQVDENNLTYNFDDVNATGKVKVEYVKNPAALDDNLYCKTTDATKPYDVLEGDNGVKALQARINSVVPAKVEIFNGGNNIYYIPVEHNAAANTTFDGTQEGFYGVVRNHWYKIDVKSIKYVGHGLYNPEDGTEVIIPDEKENPKYKVEAKINVLSWRVITQNVDL